MYKISEFSKITGLTVKALRYYDEEGILKASTREENGYRFYSMEDFNRAQLIVRLRELDFSIAEIKEVVSNMETGEDLNYYLEEKQEMVRKRIEKDKQLLKKIEDCLNPVSSAYETAKYEIGIKELEPVKVAAIRYKGKYSDVGKYIGTIYREIKGQAAGMPFNCYFDDAYVESADIMLCVPVKDDVNVEKAELKVLPKRKVLWTIHKGSYETLNIAYKAVLDYAKAHHLVCSVPSREVYHKGPGMIFKGNPDRYVTEILIPYEEEKENEQL